jgi:hypothetical protein
MVTCLCSLAWGEVTHVMFYRELSIHTKSSPSPTPQPFLRSPESGVLRLKSSLVFMSLFLNMGIRGFSKGLEANKVPSIKDQHNKDQQSA